jgi:Possible lysine decarboxylase
MPTRICVFCRRYRAGSSRGNYRRHAACLSGKGSSPHRLDGSENCEFDARAKSIDGRISRCLYRAAGRLRHFRGILRSAAWTQIGIQRKPCGLLNVEGYYDGLLKMFDHAVEEHFLKPAHRQMVISDDGPEPLVDRLLAYQFPSVEKWPDPNNDRQSARQEL